MHDVLVIGSGPAGLSCAIEATRAGLSTVVLDKGSLVDAIRRFPRNIIWFSTPELLEIGGLPFVVSGMRPTRIEVLNYYQRVAEHYRLDVRTFEAVEHVRRRNGALSVDTESGNVFPARNVIVATGYFDNPNRLNVPGENLGHVMHYYDEPFMYHGCEVVVVGGRNSAVEAALDLFRHGSRVTLVHRGERLSQGVKYWVLPDIENRIKSGEVKTVFGARVRRIRPASLDVEVSGGIQELPCRFVFILIGFHPDTAHLSRFGIHIDPDTLAPHHDTSTFETNIPHLYVAGSVVAGRFNNKVFVENGRLHGGVIVKSILSGR
jgi:thioredoxin reductase (NADPH)